MTVVYLIRGFLKGMIEAEDIDVFENRREAEAMMRQYRKAFGRRWTLWVGAVLLTTPQTSDSDLSDYTAH